MPTSSLILEKTVWTRIERIEYGGTILGNKCLHACVSTMRQSRTTHPLGESSIRFGKNEIRAIRVSITSSGFIKVDIALLVRPS